MSDEAGEAPLVSDEAGEAPQFEELRPVRLRSLRN